MPQVPRPAPHFIRPRTPRAPGRERTFESGGRELRPLAGPDIEVPEEQEEDFELRFQGWEAQNPGGSRPEFICYEFLRLDRRQIPERDFIYQYPLLGGRTIYGGFIADFFIVRQETVWRVQGEHFHLRTPDQRARDRIGELMLSDRGFRVINLWEDDVLTRPDFVLPLAFDKGLEVRSRTVL